MSTTGPDHGRSPEKDRTVRDAELERQTERALRHGPTTPIKMSHPPGLFLLFFVEMWERFSYYGMRAILVLYLVSALNPEPTKGLFSETIINPGRGWTEAQAYKLYGLYTGLAYLLPILGGFLADKILGTHRSMVLGAITIAIGHVVLAVSGLGDMEHNSLGMAVFVGGLALIILGTGYFKPTVSVMVGQLYPQGDPRRDGAFSIFYMGINLGAFICAFVCGTLGEKVGWHWGFGSAAVGMLAGMFLYLWGKKRFLAGIGDPPANKPNIVVPLFLGTCVVSALVGWAYYAGVFGSVADAFGKAMSNGAFAAAVTYVLPVAIFAAIAWFIGIQKPGDKGPVFCIFTFIFFNAFFWLAFEQAGSTLNVFAQQSTNRHIFGWEMPASWFQSFNAGFIILFAPVFAAIWGWLGRRNMNPSQPLKISYGLILLGLGYLFMVFAAEQAATGVKVGIFWLTATYFLHTMGELCLSPTGLSFVTKAAPARFVSFLMGMWFLSSFVANYGGGLVAAQVTRIESGELVLWWSHWFEPGSRAPFFMLFVFSSIGAGLVIFAFYPILKRLLHGRG
ncbi:MAG: peptide MFS transporter [Phycisphaerales bacterium]